MSASPRTLHDCARVLRRVGRQLYQQGHMPATSGNLSMRIDDASCAVTASGRDKGRLRTDDVVRVTFAARGGELQDTQAPAHSSLRPSAETALHTSLYARFPGVGAVFHTHSRASTVLSRLAAASSEIWLESYELGKTLQGVANGQCRLRIPIFDNDPDMLALAARVTADLERNAEAPCHGYIIRSHGLYAWGGSWQEALRHLEALDFMLDCELAVRAHTDRPIVRNR
jgi:methylthioribulose-1-phosphate dehydratase